MIGIKETIGIFCMVAAIELTIHYKQVQEWLGKKILKFAEWIRPR